MGEIKSTMDIIMEKTKGMTLTDEEKRDIQRREVEGKVQGLVQKLVDGLIDVARLRADMAGFTGQKGSIAEEALRKEVISRLDPLWDNSQLLAALKSVLGTDPSPYDQILSPFGESLASEAARRESLLQEEFEKRGVSGGAVIPNLNADPEWSAHLKKKREELRERLTSIKT